MTQNVDYGVVPGTEKATLLNPGAEKLALVFKLDVQPSNELIWGPSEPLHRHLPGDRVPRPDRHPAGLRGGHLLKPRAQPRVPQARANLPELRAARGDQGQRGVRRWLAVLAQENGCGAKFPDGDQRVESQEVGEIENPDLPDTWNAVDKMAKKRGYVDAVLSVTGASAIFTQDIGADPSDAEANGLEHGAVVSGALKPAARQAAIKLCGGDIEQAKALWEKLQGEFDGYMPEAPARTLLLAAEHAAQPTGEHQQASSQTDGPAIGETRPRNRRGRGTRTSKRSPRRRPRSAGSPHGQGDPNPAPAAGRAQHGSA